MVMGWRHGKSVQWRVQLPFQIVPRSREEAENAITHLSMELDNPDKYSASERLWMREKIKRIRRFLDDAEYRGRMCRNYNVLYEDEPKETWEGYKEWRELICQEADEESLLLPSQLDRLIELAFTARGFRQQKSEGEAIQHQTDIEYERRRRETTPDWNKRPYLRYTELGDPAGESAFVIPPLEEGILSESGILSSESNRETIE